MSTLSLSSALFVVASTAAGGGVAWLAASLHYRTKLAERGLQLQQAEQSKQKAQELALQARAQVEALQQALSEAKRDGVIQNAAQTARTAAAASAVAERLGVREAVRALVLVFGLELAQQLGACLGFGGFGCGRGGRRSTRRLRGALDHTIAFGFGQRLLQRFDLSLIHI